MDCFDSVYMFLWSGWREEFRSNRWNFAKRWGHRLPTIVLQPELTLGAKAVARSHDKLAGVTVLSVTSMPEKAHHQAAYGLGQSAQIAQHLASHGYRRPLFWLYNPHFVGAFSFLPAAYRVTHASENYFDFEASSDFLDLHRAALSVSDRVIAVSGGVADGIRRECPKARVDVVTNGVDFAEYSSTRGESAWRERRGKWKRVAVYAGNINNRLDFTLIRRLVEENASDLFWFIGEVRENIPGADRTIWRALKRNANFVHSGALDPEELPGVYRAADVGIIPYLRTPLLERNGFPLKALEMAATGLPVVSTLMEPIRGLEPAVFLAENENEFMSIYRRHDRASRSNEDRDRAVAIAAAHDYDKKFDAIVSLLSDDARSREPARSVVDTLTSFAGYERHLGALAAAQASLRTPLLKRAGRKVVRSMPRSLTGRIPPPVRAKLRTLLGISE